MSLLENTVSRAKAGDFSSLLTTGAVAGLAAGFPFIVANMIYATSQSQLMNPSYPLAELITHFSLSIVFGLSFAVVVVPLLSSARLLLIGGVAFGGLLYFWTTTSRSAQ